MYSSYALSYYSLYYMTYHWSLCNTVIESAMNSYVSPVSSQKVKWSAFPHIICTNITKLHLQYIF